MKIKAMPGRVIAQLQNPADMDIVSDSGLFVGKREIKEVTHWEATVTDSSHEDILVGDKIIFGKYAGSTLADDYVSVLVSDILGIL